MRLATFLFTVGFVFKLNRVMSAPFLFGPYPPPPNIFGNLYGPYQQPGQQLGELQYQ